MGKSSRPRWPASCLAAQAWNRSASSTSSAAMPIRERHYVGLTSDVERRRHWHNTGPSGVTDPTPAVVAGGVARVRWTRRTAWPLRALPEDRLRPRLREAALRPRRRRVKGSRRRAPSRRRPVRPPRGCRRGSVVTQSGWPAVLGWSPQLVSSDTPSSASHRVTKVNVTRSERHHR